MQTGHCEDLVVEFTAFGRLLVLKLTLNRQVLVWLWIVSMIIQLTTYLPTFLHFNGCFSSKSWLASFLTCSRREHLDVSIHFRVVFTGWMFFLSANQDCQSTKRNIESTDSNQWPGLILSSSTTGLLTEGALLPFCQLSIASTNTNYDLFCYFLPWCWK